MTHTMRLLAVPALAAILFCVATTASRTSAELVGGQTTEWADCEEPCKVASTASVPCNTPPATGPCRPVNRDRCKDDESNQCQNRVINPPGPDNSYQDEPCQPNPPVPGATCKQPFQRCIP